MDYEQIVKRATELKDKMYWFKKELLEMYVEHGNYRKVSELTRIPITTIHDIVRKAKNEIKEELWD